MPWENEEEETAPHSEVRTVTVTLSSANYRFDIVQPLDSAGVERSRFAAGETVRMRVKMTNKGDVKSNFTRTVSDVDTGEVLDTYTGAGVDPDKFIDANLLIGTMPNRNWNLRVEVTP